MRYPRDGVVIDFASNGYLDQYRDLKFFNKEYVREEKLSPFIIYTDMKHKYPIQETDLGFQVDHNNSEEVSTF